MGGNNEGHHRFSYLGKKLLQPKWAKMNGSELTQLNPSLLLSTISRMKYPHLWLNCNECDNSENGEKNRFIPISSNRQENAEHTNVSSELLLVKHTWRLETFTQTIPLCPNLFRHNASQCCFIAIITDKNTLCTLRYQSTSLYWWKVIFIRQTLFPTCSPSHALTKTKLELKLVKLLSTK